MDSVLCRSRDEALAYFADSASARRAVEYRIASRRRWLPRSGILGSCDVDRRPTVFGIDRQWGGHQLDNGVWMPNWRERLVCIRCHLNNRQRAIAADLLDAVRQAPDTRVIYLMEQVTPMFRVITSRAGTTSVIGSEYVGSERTSGELVNGIRHEDAEALSFGSGSIDFVMSNDVFEHVPNPEKAFAEAARVLKPGGRLFFSVPFYTDRSHNAVRATLVNGKVNHLVEPEYHGNPFAAGGSLVFTDFSWEMLDVVRGAGFSDCAAVTYWSLQHGHLGGNLLHFVATK